MNREQRRAAARKGLVRTETNQLVANEPIMFRFGANANGIAIMFNRSVNNIILSPAEARIVLNEINAALKMHEEGAYLNRSEAH